MPMKNMKIFKDCKVVDGVVTWMDEEIDCAPEFIYEKVIHPQIFRLLVHH